MGLSIFSKTGFKDAAKHDLIVSFKVRVPVEMWFALLCTDGWHQVTWDVSPSL